MTANAVKFEGALSADTKRSLNQYIGDTAICTSQLSVSSSTTLVDVTGMATETLLPGTYDFEIRLITTAGASGGVKAALKQSVSGMITSISASVEGLSAAATANTTFTTTTDAASIIAATTAYVAVNVRGVVVIGASGTLKVQAAQNASNGTATTVEVRSFMSFRRIA
jgi:hypothetical protein